MKTRSAAGILFSEAMDQVVELNTRADLAIYLQKNYSFWNPTNENVVIKPYGFDKRNNWSTYLICVDGKAALFSDGDFNDT
jgi:hypothetical protein